ncbi:MAG: hypothetical protein LBK82_11830 [Planctomycetaceae bacterium]|nr:hypothetical protein [Planctomycetaceae bacterium]
MRNNPPQRGGLLCNAPKGAWKTSDDNREISEHVRKTPGTDGKKKISDSTGLGVLHGNRKRIGNIS